MNKSKAQKPIGAWFILVGGGVFLFTAFPGILLILAVPFWKPEELSFFSFIYMLIALFILTVTIWGMKKAFKALKQHDKLQKSPSTPALLPVSPALQPPLWPWLLIAPGALFLIASGPGAILLPILPLFLAALSTDSGAQNHVPLLIITIGYSMIALYAFLLAKAIKALRAK